MTTKDLKEEQLSSNIIYEGKILTFIKDNIRLSNGRESIREVVLHKGGVTIIPMVDQHNVVLIKQYRYAIRKALWELPAGTLTKNEDPVNAAKRELKEETGYITNKLEPLGVVYPLPGYSSEVLYFFKALDLIDDEPEPDPDENIEVKIFDLKQVWQMIKDGEIRDAKTIAGISLVLF